VVFEATAFPVTGVAGGGVTITGDDGGVTGGLTVTGGV